MRESSFVDNHWQLISFCDSNQASPLDQAEFEGISWSCLQQITFWLIFWQLSSRIKRKIPECIIMANQESNFLSLSSWDPRGRNFSNWFVSVSFVPSLYFVCLFFMYIHLFGTILSLWERIKFKRIENFYNIKSYWLGYIAICCQVNFCSDRKSHAHHSFAFTVTWLDSVGGSLEATRASWAKTNMSTKVCTANSGLFAGIARAHEYNLHALVWRFANIKTLSCTPRARLDSKYMYVLIIV